MTKFYFVLASLIFSSVSQATPLQYEVRSKVYVDGKLMASPILSTLAGQSAAITQTDNVKSQVLMVEVVPTELKTSGEKAAVEMKFKISLKARTQIIEFSPRLSSLEGEEVVVSQEPQKPGQAKVELRATAVRRK